MKMYGGVEVYIHAIFMFVTVTDGYSASNPSHYRPGDTDTKLGGSQPV